MNIIGGGILGTASALALAERGFEVTLWDPNGLGQQATAKAAGILSTMTLCDEDFQLIQETRGAVGGLISLALAAGETTARGAWRPEDSILIGRPDTLDPMQERVERLGEEMDRLDHRAAAAEFPELEFYPGEEVLIAQEDGVIEAGDLMAAMATRLRDEGVEVKQERVVDRPEGPVVVAAGAWTPRLLAAWGHPIAATTYRAQACRVAIPGEHIIVHDTRHDFYARPDGEGLVAGDGTRFGHFDPDDYDETGDPAFREHIARGIVSRFKAGGDATINAHWAGLCVATPDQAPYCGLVPGTDDVWTLTGDNGHGLMRGLALGERLADAVEGQIDQRMDPARFPADHEFTPREGYAIH